MEDLNNNKIEKKEKFADNDPASFRKLRIFNFFMFIFHAAQGSLMLYLSNDFALPIKTYFLKFNPELQQLFSAEETVWELPLGPVVAGFLFLSALAHLLLVMPKINDWYNRNLAKGKNPARWLEYTFSSSLMIVVIAMLFGMYDMVSLIFIFSLNAMMILFGWVMEEMNQYTEKVKWMPYIFGCIAGIIPWIGILIYLVGSGEGGNVPNFVYWIFATMLVTFNIFAINMVLQYKKVGKWRNYLYGEYVYIVLSLVAKSLLAWQVWAGTLRPE